MIQYFRLKPPAEAAIQWDGSNEQEILDAVRATGAPVGPGGIEFVINADGTATFGNPHGTGGTCTVHVGDYVFYNAFRAYPPDYVTANYWTA